MLNGDISSYTPPTILIRVEDTLIKTHDTKLLGFTLRTSYELDENTYGLIMRLSMKTHYKVNLVCDSGNYNSFKEYLEDVDLPFVNLMYHSTQTITNFLNNGIYYCYIDNNLDRIERVNHKSCYSVAEFTNLVL